MSWSFHAGQRVVCLNHDGWQLEDAECAMSAGPIGGNVYTVTDVYDLALDDGSHSFLSLLEFDQDDGWLSECFRPLDDARLDQFRAHLAPASRIPVRA